MNGVHDMGGFDGHGAVDVEENEPVWHADWEKAVFTMFPALFVKGFFNLDEFRHAIEQIPPAEYLGSSYYEHWLHSVIHHGVEKGNIDADELAERTRYYLDNPDAPLPGKQDGELVGLIEGVIAAGGTARRDSDAAPRFAVGDRVLVADDHPFGHTRRARYIRGKTGVIDRSYDAYIYPDSAGNGGAEDPQRVYSVRFDARELWGAEHAEPNASVYFDVWEPYLQPIEER